MAVGAVIAYFVCLAITTGYGQTPDCSTHPFAAECLQRRVFNKTIGYATLAACRIPGDFNGSIILVNVVSTNSTNAPAQVANNVQPDERNETCLLKQLQPKFTGYPSVSNVPIDYLRCGVDKTHGYIILIYTCIKAEPRLTVKLPQCSGSFTGSKIRIESNGFPDYGWNTTGVNCQCSINSSTEFINVTTYKLQLTPQQSVAIINDKGTGYNSSAISLNGAPRVRDTIRANGTLSLKWYNTEPVVVSSSMFWIEIEVSANGSLISVQCDQQVMTTMSTLPTTQTKQTTPPTNISSEAGYTKSSSESVSTDMRTRNVTTSPTFATAFHHTDGTGVLTSTAVLQTGRTTSDNSSSLSNGSPGPSPVSGGEAFPIIPVIVGLLVFLIIILIILAILYKKHRKHKEQREKATTNVADEGSKDNDDGQTSDSPTKQRTPLQKDEPNYNTKFSAANHLPPIWVRNQTNGTGEVNINIEEGGGITVDKTKKKKKKRKKKHDNDAQEDSDYEKTETGDTEKKRMKKKKKRNKVYPGDEPNIDGSHESREDGTHTIGDESKISSNKDSKDVQLLLQ